MEQAHVGLVGATEQAAMLLHPVRMQLLERFRQPASAAEVARVLGLPRQRVGHHVRLLQQHALLEQVGERRRGNFVERLLQATARAYVIAPQALGALAAADDVRDRFSSEYQAAAASRTLRDLCTLRDHADAAGKRLATLTLETAVRFGGPAAQAAFAEELATLLGALVRKYHDDDAPNGRRFRFTLCGHPALPAAPDTQGDDDANPPS